MDRFRFFLKAFAGIAFFVIILFVCAGRLDYEQGWIYAAVSLLGLMTDCVLTGKDIELLKERSKFPGDARDWDKNILKLSALVTVIAYAVAGLDSGRYQWSPRLPRVASIVGIVVMVTGQCLFLIAKKTNRFFSSVMRIQSDRGHTVCEAGLYRFVRHPGYLGMITSWIAFPLVLGSIWSGIPVAVAIILLLMRTRLEDMTLIRELACYNQYAQRTGYRLIPGIW